MPPHALGTAGHPSPSLGPFLSASTPHASHTVRIKAVCTSYIHGYIYTMLCYAMLCYAMLCYAMLCYTILYYAILYYTTLYYTIPY